MKNVIFNLIISLFIISCNSDNQTLMDLGNVDFDLDLEVDIPSTSTNEFTPNHTLEKKTPQKIIKDGEITINVSDLEKSKIKIDSIISQYNGYYEREELKNDTWQQAYELKIRVPSNAFEKVIIQIEPGYGSITHKKIKSRDVTDQFIDIETRLKNKRNYLQKYNDLLKRAKTVKEILEIEEKIRKLEEEIESQTGRLNYLSDLVAYSTLELTLNKPIDEKYQAQERDDFSKRIVYAFSSGWIGFGDFIVFMFKLWPFIILLGIIIYGWRRYRAKKKK
ncbi:DUF4349 domain-containing protein [Flammeovirga sp. SJP92]|uniref:DUF4349 domain-containing protein n=1 Tax=Flammeovirga sp. SJP92 TaxID=1775430 RepID=UPI0007894215|nr:DUF4349 domain-containing protein [Flammeovirga sp. SJP92]KXX69566.1 hypothetical protein AVL50_15975 [Flammeovirga sp. SJP92]